MTYNVAILGMSLFGIISCGEHWFENEKLQIPNSQKWNIHSDYRSAENEKLPNSNSQKWNINSDYHSDIQKENDFDFQSTYEVLDTIPPDLSKISRYLGKSISLDVAPQDLGEIEISKFEGEIEQITTPTPPKRVVDERPLVPIQEQIEDVQPGAFQVDRSRPELILKDTKDYTTPPTIRKDNTRPPTIRKDNTRPPIIRKYDTRSYVTHDTRSHITRQGDTRSHTTRQDHTKLNAQRHGPIFDYERKHRFHVKWD